MKSNKLRGICFVTTFGLFILAACSAQTTETIPPTRQISPSSTSTFTTKQTLPTLTLTPTITITPTPQYLVRPISKALPPGQYLTYVDRHVCDPTDIYSRCNLNIISIDGSVDQTLARDLPAGKYIYNKMRVASTTIYYDEFDHQRFRIRLLDMESGQFIDIPTPAGIDCLAEDWSPDGTKLVVICHTLEGYYNFDIALLSLPDGELTILVHDMNENGDSGGYEQPRWSSDGKWLAFNRLSGSGPELTKGLYITDMSCLSEPSTCQAKTHEMPVKQLEGERGNREFAWTADSYLAKAIDNRIDVYDVKSGQRIRIFRADPARGDIYDVAWSPDGKWVAVDQSDIPGVLLIPVDGGHPLNLNIFMENPFWLTIP
jgi:WD40 repeat protein